MKLSAIKTPTTEVYLENENIQVTATSWGNHEGVNVMVTCGKDAAVRTAFAMRWEEADMLVAVLSVARTP